MKLFLDLHKAEVKPPKPPKVPKVPGGTDASKPEKKTGLPSGSSEKYDYVSKQQYAERPQGAIGETEGSWIVPKGSKLGKVAKEEQSTPKQKETEAEPVEPKQEASPEIKSDPLHEEDGSQLGVEDVSPEQVPLSLNENEGNTRKDFQEAAKPGNEEQKIKEEYVNPETKETVDLANAKTQADKDLKTRDKNLGDDFDALVAELDAADADKSRRKEVESNRSKKEKEVIKDVLKDDGAGFVPKSSPEKKVETQSGPKEENNSTPDLSRSKDKEGLYNPVKHGSAAKKQAVEDYAQQQFAFSKDKEKYAQAREKHQKAVEAYSVKKENAARKQQDYADNKESFDTARDGIKNTIKDHKNRLKEANTVLADLREVDDYEAIATHKKKIDKITRDLEKEESKLQRLEKKEPKKPEKFTEKEPKFTEKEPKQPSMVKPKDEMEHMKWQDHVRSADKLAKKVEDALKDESLPEAKRKRLEMIHEKLSYHSGMHSMPSPDHIKEKKELERLAKEAGVDPKEETESPTNTKPITMPTGIGARLGRVGTTAEAAADIPAILSDYGVGGVAKLAQKLLTGKEENKDLEEEDTSAAGQGPDIDTSAAGDKYEQKQNVKPNAGFPTQGKPSSVNPDEAVGTIPNPGNTNRSKMKDDMDKENKKFGKSMNLYLDLSKAIGTRPNVSVDSDKDKNRQNKRHENSFDRDTAGSMGGDMSHDSKEVGKEWKSLEEEDIINTLESTKKSLDALITPYSTEKEFLNKLGYSDQDIKYGRIVLKSSETAAYKDFLLENLTSSLSSLKKAL